MDKDTEIMVLRHQVLILERQLNARVAYRLWIGVSPPSPGCCRDGAGAPSSSRQRRSFAGTEALGAQMAAPAIHSWPWSAALCRDELRLIVRLARENRRWVVSASRASFEASEVPRTKRRRPTLRAFSDDRFGGPTPSP